MKIKPAPGRMVRDPRTMLALPEEGRDVPRTPFWLRRLRDGDVVFVDEARPSAHHAAARHKGT
jgi:hypothetical protein